MIELEAGLWSKIALNSEWIMLRAAHNNLEMENWSSMGFVYLFQYLNEEGRYWP